MKRAEAAAQVAKSNRDDASPKGESNPLEPRGPPCRGHQPRTLSTGSGQTSNLLKVRNSSSRVEWTSPACPNGGCAGELASGVDRVAAFDRSLASAAVDRGSRPSAAAADRGIETDVATADPCIDSKKFQLLRHLFLDSFV